MSKKVIGAAGIIAVILIIVLATIVPKAANARKAEEQLHLGDTYLSELEYEQAEAAYLAVIEIDPKNVDAYIGLAEVYLAQGKYNEAIEILEQALDEIGDNEEIKRKLEEAEQAKKVAVVTPEPTATPIPKPTATSTPTPSPEPTATSTPAPSPEPTATSTPVPSTELATAGNPMPGSNLETTATSGLWTGLSEEQVKDILLGQWNAETQNQIFTETEHQGNDSVQEQGGAGTHKWEYQGMVTYPTADTGVALKFAEESEEYYLYGVYEDAEDISDVPEGGFVTYDVLDTSTGEWEVARQQCPTKSVEKENGTSVELTLKEVVEEVVNGIEEKVTPTPTTAPTSAPDPEPTVTPTPSPTSTPTPEPTATPTPSPTSTPTPEPTATATPTPAPKELFDSPEDFTWVESGDGIEITGIKDKNAVVVVIPSEIEGKSVVSIGERAFYGCRSLTSVSIPEGVTSIEVYAFGSCGSLSSISLPKGLTSIRQWAFSSCRSLSSISLPEGLTSIEYGTFGSCDSLSSISLPESLTSIGDGAFYDCSSLSSINLAEGNTKYAVVNGCLYSKDMTELICVPGGVQGSVTILEGVTSIGRYAFYGCSSLNSINLAEGNTEYAVENGCLYSKDMTELICVPGGVQGSITIPEGVTSIGMSAFYGCSNLSSINLPEGVTDIGARAFDGCSSLSSITLPEGVTSIVDRAFQSCHSLNSISLPEGVTSIERYAFGGCRSLSSITLPEGVTSIGDRAFERCSNLSSISLPESVTSIEKNAFQNCDSLKTLTVQPGSYAETWAIENGYNVVNP